MVHIIDHVPNLDLVLNDVSRVLKPSGNFYFSGLTADWKKVIGAKSSLKAPCFNDYHYHLYNHDEWAAILKKKGLKMVDHGYFITPKMARLYYFILFIYHAKRDGLKIFERIPSLDKYYSDMIVNFLIPLCERDLAACKSKNRGANFWVHARQTEENHNQI